MNDILEIYAVLEIYQAALKSADPYAAVKKALYRKEGRLTVNGTEYDLDAFSKVVVIGAGKGTAPMARAVEDIVGNRLDDGIIIVKYGHAGRLRKVRQVEAGHPVPDLKGLRGTAALLGLIGKADAGTLIICLLSGGGSALLVSPVEGVTLEDKQRTTELLLKSGATIGELNTVRKHLSGVKGGRLAVTACKASIVTLALSDVIDDRPDVIASGPTVPDNSTFEEALEIVTRLIEKLGPTETFPKRALDHLFSGAGDRAPETPKEGDPCFKNKEAFIVGSLKQAISAAWEKAKALGFETKIVTDRLQGEAKDAAVYLAGIAGKAKKSVKGGRPVCLISGGETTVTVKGNGLGGRNQELALAFAAAIEGKEGITLLSAGTDGTDGPTDAAGAVVDGRTIKTAKRLGLDPEAYLRNNDSYTFFKKLDARSGGKAHLLTGPTGTNVMDVQIMLVEK
jgi:hydroxypyruvate reductase